MSNFKRDYTLVERKQESDRIRFKYPDRIPVICEKVKSNRAPVRCRIMLTKCKLSEFTHYVTLGYRQEQVSRP